MGGDNVGKGSFGCVACTSMMALICYAVGLSIPFWSGYWVNDRKCERDDGCGIGVKKGEDVSEGKCQFRSHGIYIWRMWGPTKPGLEYTKKQNKDKKKSPEDLKKDCEDYMKRASEFYLKEKVDDAPKCTYDEDSLVCACPYASKDLTWKVFDSLKGNDTSDSYCKDMKKKYDDIKVEDTSIVDLHKAGWGNIHIAAATLITACCCHFIAMIMGYLGLATGHFAMGIVASCMNIIAIACGITGLVTGTAGTYLVMTADKCGSWKWYKESEKSDIPQPDDQVHPMGMGAIMVIVGVVFSVISACLACGSVAAAKRASAQKAADSNYNKF